MAWQKNGTPDTLGSLGDSLTIPDQTSTIFNMSMAHLLASGAIQHKMRFGFDSVDSATNYAWRRSGNGGSDGTASSVNEINANQSTADIFAISYTINISAEEKLSIGFTSEQSAVGAGNAPSRMEFVGKWANTSTQYNNVNVFQDNVGDFAIDTNLSALGTD